MFVPARLSYAEDISLKDANALNEKVNALYTQGEYADAVPSADLVLKVKEKALGPSHPEVAQALNQLALLHKAAGDYGKVEKLYKRALSIYTSNFGPGHSSVALVQNNLANYYVAAGDHVTAEVYYKSALEIFEKTLGPNHPGTIKTLDNLGKLYYAVKDAARAEYYIEMALKRAEKNLGPHDPLTNSILEDLKELHEAGGDDLQAGQRSSKNSSNEQKHVPDETQPKPPLDTIGMTTPEWPAPSKAEAPAVAEGHTALRAQNIVSSTAGTISPEKRERQEEPTRPTHERAISNPAPAPSEENIPRSYTLYLGSFRSLTLADRALDIYTNKGLSPHWREVDLGEKGVWYRVYTGHFSNKEEAEKARQEFGLTDAEVKRSRTAGPVKVRKPDQEMETRTGRPKKEATETMAQHSPLKAAPATGQTSHPGVDAPLPYSLYLGSFQTLKLAERAVKEYADRGLSPYWSRVNLGDKGVWYRIYLGHYANMEEALKVKQEFGLQEAIVKKIKYANLIKGCASSSELDAEAFKLKEMGYSPYAIESPDGKTFLYLGAFLTMAGAEALHLELKSRGIENQMVEW